MKMGKCSEWRNLTKIICRLRMLWETNRVYYCFRSTKINNSAETWSAKDRERMNKNGNIDWIEFLLERNLMKIRLHFSQLFIVQSSVIRIFVMQEQEQKLSSSMIIHGSVILCIRMWISSLKLFLFSFGVPNKL